MSNARRSGLFLVGVMAAALIGGTGLSFAVPALQPVVHEKTRRGLFNGVAYSDVLIGRKGTPLTCAQQKRASSKRRNQLRHKRTVRG